MVEIQCRVCSCIYFGNRRAWVQARAYPLPSCVTLGHQSFTEFPLLENRENNGISFIDCCVDSMKSWCKGPCTYYVFPKCQLLLLFVIQCLAHSQYSLRLFPCTRPSTPPSSTGPSASVLCAQALLSVCSRRNQSSLSSNSSQHPRFSSLHSHLFFPFVQQAQQIIQDIVALFSSTSSPPSLGM